MKIALIAAIGKSGQLGKDNQLLWHIPEDLKMFKKITLGSPIIMGRKTYESIGRPLPGRENYVITSQKNYQAPGIEVYPSLNDAIASAEKVSEKIFIIGGGQIYTEALERNIPEVLYVTHTDYDGDADVFFPLRFLDNYQVTSSEIITNHCTLKIYQHI